MALPCLPHLLSQNLGAGGLWVRAALHYALGVLRNMGQSAGEQACDTWEKCFAPSCVLPSGLCMLCCPCALVCCLCQCEDTIKCIFLWVLTFGDFVGVAVVQGSNGRSRGDKAVAWVF